MASVTPDTRLSALRSAASDDRSIDGAINPRLIKSIQQSLAVEGYVYSEESVRAAVERASR